MACYQIVILAMAENINVRGLVGKYEMELTNILAFTIRFWSEQNLIYFEKFTSLIY